MAYKRREIEPQMNSFLAFLIQSSTSPGQTGRDTQKRTDITAAPRFHDGITPSSLELVFERGGRGALDSDWDRRFLVIV